MKLKVIPALFITLLLVLIFSYACTKKDVYPVEPHIDFKSFEKIFDTKANDTVGVIGLYFTDGDGDLGLRPTDTTINYRYNLFIKYFEKKKGKFEEVILTAPSSLPGKLDTLWFNARIPDLTPAGKTKTITGEIYDTLYINNLKSSLSDTIKYQIYIQDRALHKSNVVATPEFIVYKKTLKP